MRFCFCAFVARSSNENRGKIVRTSTKIQPKSVQNRPKINLGLFWAPKAVSETRPDTFGMVFGHPNAAPKPILGRPGHAKSGQESSKSVPGLPQRRYKSLPVGRPSACGAPSAVERAFGLIFRRFCAVARTLRCAFRISFNGVLLTSDEGSAARARTAKTLENQGASASKIEPGTIRATQNRARSGGKTRKSVRSLAFFFLAGRLSQSNGQSSEKRASCWAGRSANACPKPPGARQRTSIEMTFVGHASHNRVAM